MKKPVTSGISGQDGALLGRFLINKGYEVFGTSRDIETSAFGNLDILGIRKHVNLVSMTPSDYRSVLNVISKYEPDEIYNLAGQTSVSLSFEQPVETRESIRVGTLNMLEAIRFTGNGTKFYNACSSECFGNTEKPANENTAFMPRSPYAIAKATAFWDVANYREAYGIHACSGILFNHESPLRHSRFVTKKIVNAVINILERKSDELVLGNIGVLRDWGWAPEYVEAMWKIMQHDRPEDFVIATGESNTLEQFVEAAFDYVGLKAADYVKIDYALRRITDLDESRADVQKARDILGWSAKYKMRDVAHRMIEFGLGNTNEIE